MKNCVLVSVLKKLILKENLQNAGQSLNALTFVDVHFYAEIRSKLISNKLISEVLLRR